MPNARTHPTPKELTAFGQGKLPDAIAAVVAEHLESCPACRQTVEKSPPDSFVGKLRRGSPGASALPTYLPDSPGTRSSQSSAPFPVDSPPDLPPELASHPKYRVVRELGRGGMGVVYQAVQTLMERHVALKVINPAVLNHPEALPRFRAEVRAAARLDHPNIVRAYDAEQVGDLHLLVMEYVEGTNLADGVRRRGVLPVKAACYYLRQAALGLQHAFEQGMVHRDIKPGNLMVADGGIVKILDFGLARLRTEGKSGGLTQMDAFMGTPEYVSPEQATDARTADIRSDIYSLGCTLYYMLAGRPPFQEDTAVKQVLAQIEQEPPSLESLRSDVAPELAAVASKMLAKDPAQRYQTPIELARALVAFIKMGEKEPAVAVPTPAPATHSPARETAFGRDTSRMPAIRKKPAQTLLPDRVAPPSPTASTQSPIAKQAQANKASGAIQKQTERPRVSGSGKRGPVIPWLIALAGGMAAAMVAGFVLFWPTPRGMIKIESDDPNVEIVFDQNGPTVKGADKEPIAMAVGKHGILIKRGDFQFEADKFVLEKGQMLTLKVELIRGSIQVWAGGQPIGVKVLPALAPVPNERDTTGTVLGSGGSTLPQISPRPFLSRGEWAVVNDELIQPTLATGRAAPFIALGDITLSNYDLTLDVKKTGGRDSMGVRFHWLGPGHYRYYSLAGNGGIDFGYVYNDQWGREDSNWKWQRYSSNQWYSLKLEVRGEVFRAYLDGLLQFEHTDRRFAHGRIALFTSAAAAHFRRLKVTDPKGNVLLQRLPELRLDARMARKLDERRDRVPLPGEAAAKAAQESLAQRLKTEAVSTDSLGIKLALVPSGEFQMGSPRAEARRDGNEEQHRIRITRPFYLGVYAISQDEYRRVTGRNPSWFSNSGGTTEDATFDTSQFPVETVTWYDAIEFCNKLSEREGRHAYYQLTDIDRDRGGWIKGATVSIEGGDGYRLPTEAEWEYACRAGTNTAFNFGADNNGLDCNCNGEQPYGTDKEGPWPGCTVRVGSYRSNAFGLYDMHGNVHEWCWDAFDPDYYKRSPLSDPIGPPSGYVRVLRGGCWWDSADICRAAWRGHESASFRRECTGFRVARDVVLSVAAVAPAKPVAAQPKTTTDKSARAASRSGGNDDGYQSLLRGTKLTDHWTPIGFPWSWTVQPDGALRGRNNGEDAVWLVSKRCDYRNFRIRLSVKAPTDRSSALVLREQSGDGAHRGYRIALGGMASDKVTRRKPGSIIELTEDSGASNERHVEARDIGADPTQPVLLEAEVVDDAVRTFVNGQSVAEYRRLGDTPRSGEICLACSEALDVDLIEIKELPTTPSAEAPRPNSAGFVRLFNGRDLSGWHFVGAGTTTAANGVLTLQNSASADSPSYLVTDRNDYSDFHFRCETMVKERWKPSVLMCRLDTSPVLFGGMRGYAVAVGGPEPTHKADVVRTALIMRPRGGLILSTSKPQDIRTGKWHRFEVIAKGERLRFVLDGRTVLDISDRGQAFSHGAIAIVSRPDYTNLYRNLEIRELNGNRRAAAGEGRTRWAHRSLVGDHSHERWGAIQHVKGREWIETVGEADGIFQFAFTETERTADYVELERPIGDGKIIIRLYANRSETGPSRDRLGPWHVGDWVH